MRRDESSVFDLVRNDPVVRDFDEAARGAEPARVRLALHIPAADLTHVGLSLYHLDLEMRRTAALYFDRGGDSSRSRALPLPVSTGGLKVVDIAPGSVDVVLDAVGLVATMLASAPVTAFVNTITILEWFDRIRVYRPSPATKSFGGGAEELGNALAGLGASGPPDAELYPDDLLGRAGRMPGVRIRLPDGTKVTARRAAIEVQRDGDKERVIILAD